MKLNTVLVWHDGSLDADDLIRLACQTSRSTARARVVVLAVTPVHPSLPLTGLPPGIDWKAAAALHRAETIATACGCTIECRLRHARDTAQAVVREARDLRADAIFAPLGTPRLGWRAPGPSATTRNIMRQAPCPVFLAHSPSTDSLDPSTAIGEAERILHRPGAR